MTKSIALIPCILFILAIMLSQVWSAPSVVHENPDVVCPVHDYADVAFLRVGESVPHKKECGRVKCVRGGQNGMLAVSTCRRFNTSGRNCKVEVRPASNPYPDCCPLVSCD